MDLSSRRAMPGVAYPEDYLTRLADVSIIRAQIKDNLEIMLATLSAEVGITKL
jgi:hypothetical protein